jgi:2-methylcitrate dehydratase PrpD
MVMHPDVIELMEKVTMKSDPSLAEDGYTGATNIININTKDGKKYSLRVDHAKGSPENPMHLEELLEKYKDCAGTVLGPAALERSTEILLELEKLDRINDLISLLNEF